MSYEIRPSSRTRAAAFTRAASRMGKGLSKEIGGREATLECR